MPNPTMYGNRVRGLRDLKVAPYPTGNAVDVGAAIEATIEDRVDYGELKGDDAIQEVASAVEAATLKLTAGGITPEAIAVITGRSVVESGTTPNRQKVFSATADRFPYFRLFGKALGPTDDDAHIIVYHAKLTKSPAISMRNGEFIMTEAEGICTPDPTTGTIYDYIAHETATDLPLS